MSVIFASLKFYPYEKMLFFFQFIVLGINVFSGIDYVFSESLKYCHCALQ